MPTAVHTGRHKGYRYITCISYTCTLSDLREVSVVVLCLQASFFVGNMWEGWTEKEVAEMIREVQLDCNLMIAFHERVLRSQFWLWTLVPVFGWVSAPSRWISMKRNWQKYEAWARSSRVALIRNEIVVVSLPQCSCTDPPQVWLDTEMLWLQYRTAINWWHFMFADMASSACASELNRSGKISRPFWQDVLCPEHTFQSENESCWPTRCYGDCWNSR